VFPLTVNIDPEGKLAHTNPKPSRAAPIVGGQCFLLPLKHANARRDVHYLRRSGQSATIWRRWCHGPEGWKNSPAASSTGAALLELLRRYWVKQDAKNLPKLIPYLVDLRRELVESHPVKDDQEPRLSEFVYPILIEVLLGCRGLCGRR
jgi:hypothetical protein